MNNSVKNTKKRSIDDMCENVFEFVDAVTEYNDLSLSNETIETFKNNNNTASALYRDNLAHNINLNKKLRSGASEVIMNFDKMLKDIKPKTYTIESFQISQKETHKM